MVPPVVGWPPHSDWVWYMVESFWMSVAAGEAFSPVTPGTVGESLHAAIVARAAAEENRRSIFMGGTSVTGDDESGEPFQSTNRVR